MEKIITTELSFIPIQSNNYNADVDEVIKIIASYKMEYTVGSLSTTVRGDRTSIFDMLQHIFIELDRKSKFTMVVKLSNVCGCENK